VPISKAVNLIMPKIDLSTLMSAH